MIGLLEPSSISFSIGAGIAVGTGDSVTPERFGRSCSRSPCTLRCRTSGFTRMSSLAVTLAILGGVGVVVVVVVLGDLFGGATSLSWRRNLGSRGLKEANISSDVSSLLG